MEGNKVLLIFLVARKQISLTQLGGKVKAREFPWIFHVAVHPKGSVIHVEIVFAGPSMRHSPIGTPRHRKALAVQFMPQKVPSKSQDVIGFRNNSLCLARAMRTQPFG